MFGWLHDKMLHSFLSWSHAHLCFNYSICSTFSAITIWLVLSFRRNPPGTISAHHLGEASHRLVSNSLQQKIDRNGYGNHMHTPPPPYFAAPCGPPNSFYSNGLHNHGHYGTLQPEIDYSHAGYPRSASPHMPTHYDHGYGSAGANPSYRRSRPQNERENQMSGPHPRHVYHPPEFHQNGRPRYPHGQVAHTSTGTSTYAYQGGYDAYQSYQSPGAGSHQQWGGRFPRLPTIAIPAATDFQHWIIEEIKCHYNMVEQIRDPSHFLAVLIGGPIHQLDMVANEAVSYNRKVLWLLLPLV